MLNGVAMQCIYEVAGLVANESENSQVKRVIKLQSDVNV